MKVIVALMFISGVKLGIELVETDENNCIEIDLAILRVGIIWAK